jgi:hypothetical protein
MELVVLFGPPAVGKMTVGRALGALTGYRLFHNHLVIEPLLELFEWGTPPFETLKSEWRRRVLEEAVAADVPGLVATYVWPLERPADAAELESYLAPVLGAGGTVRLVELDAPLAVRQERNNTELRLDAKRSKRDRAFNDANLVESEAYVLSSAAPGVCPEAAALLARFPFLRVENAELAPEEAAVQISAWLERIPKDN